MTQTIHKQKEEIIELVDSAGSIKFQNWYKNELTYSNGEYTVVICPAYTDTCDAETSLSSLLFCEDYNHVYVFKGKGKPWDWEWYKEGDQE